MAALLPAPASAGDPFEIQVYDAEVNEPREIGLEGHFNAVLSGRRAPAWEGEVAPIGSTHGTLEVSLGVTRWFELGGYLQLLMAPTGGPIFGGAKLRAKFVRPTSDDEACFVGANLEVGGVTRAVEQQAWGTEVRPIAGCWSGPVLFVVNPIVGFAVSGPDAFKVDFEPVGRVMWNSNRGYGAGVEYYGSVGAFSELRSASVPREHLLFAAFELMAPRKEQASGSAWELNVGVGLGLTGDSERGLVMKMILGHSL